MKGVFMELSFSFAMDLFRVKNSAESRGDAKAIASLSSHYPELFSDEFQEFIETLKVTVHYLGDKYGQDFSSLFNANKDSSVRNLN